MTAGCHRSRTFFIGTGMLAASRPVAFPIRHESNRKCLESTRSTMYEAAYIWEGVLLADNQKERKAGCHGHYS